MDSPEQSARKRRKSANEWLKIFNSFISDKKRIPVQNEIYKNENISQAFCNFRRPDKWQRLTAEQKKELDGYYALFPGQTKVYQDQHSLLGRAFNLKPRILHDQNYWTALIIEFFEKHNRLPTINDTYKGSRLNPACNYLRRKNRLGKLTKENFEKLAKLNFNWSPRKLPDYLQLVKILKEFQAKYQRFPKQTCDCAVVIKVSNHIIGN